jgi:hypothetical protein
MRRLIPSMKSRTIALVAFLGLVAPTCGALSGCSQADNPPPATAPAPPAPKAEDVQVPKRGTEKQEYGSSDRYKKAMEGKYRKGG